MIRKNISKVKFSTYGFFGLAAAIFGLAAAIFGLAAAQGLRADIVRFEVVAERYPVKVEIQGAPGRAASFEAATMVVKSGGAEVSNGRIVVRHQTPTVIKLDLNLPRSMADTEMIVFDCEYCHVRILDVPGAVHLAGKMMWVTARNVRALEVQAARVDLEELTGIQDLSATGDVILIKNAMLSARNFKLSGAEHCHIENSRVEISQDSTFVCKDLVVQKSVLRGQKMDLSGDHGVLMDNELRVGRMQFKWKRLMTWLGPKTEVARWTGDVHEARFMAEKKLDSLIKSLSARSRDFFIFEEKDRHALSAFESVGDEDDEDTATAFARARARHAAGRLSEDSAGESKDLLAPGGLPPAEALSVRSGYMAIVSSQDFFRLPDIVGDEETKFKDEESEAETLPEFQL